MSPQERARMHQQCEDDKRLVAVLAVLAAFWLAGFGTAWLVFS